MTVTKKNKKQRAANRRNARKSTGPTSIEGKLASRNNAVKHGLYARDTIIKSPRLNENSNEYRLLLAGLVEELQPEGLFQHSLVRNIADILWRRRRAAKAETAYIQRQLDHIGEDLQCLDRLKQYRAECEETELVPTTPEEHRRLEANLIGIRCMPEDSAADYISRYEMRLERQLARTYLLLERLQNRKPNHRNTLTADDNPTYLTAGTDGKNRTKYEKRTHF